MLPCFVFGRKERTLLHVHLGEPQGEQRKRQGRSQEAVTETKDRAFVQIEVLFPFKRIVNKLVGDQGLEVFDAKSGF